MCNTLAMANGNPWHHTDKLVCLVKENKIQLTLDNNDISEKLAPLKVGSANFKRPKNREDGSDFDDFWTKSITATQAVF